MEDYSLSSDEELATPSPPPPPPAKRPVRRRKLPPKLRDVSEDNYVMTLEELEQDQSSKFCRHA